MNNTVWYHATTHEAYSQIKKEGLWGLQQNGKRFTYLCKDKNEANLYGDVLLKVTYDPVQDLLNNNFSPDATEIKVTSLIAPGCVRRIN